MNDAEAEAISAFAHNKAIDAAAASLFIAAAIVNAINAQPSIDNRKFTADVIANLRKSSEDTEQDIAKWAMALLADNIANAYQKALAMAGEA